MAHLVAEDTEDARRQWEEVFGRNRADLGPSAAAAQAAGDVERYGTQKQIKPLDEVLTDLWGAWSSQADLHQQHQRLVGEHDALQQVAAIQARCAPDLERLHGEEINARRGWLQARKRVDDLDAALTSETTDLQRRVWAEWRQELAQAQRAAQVVREGAGRLGQHRREVRAASADLTAFAQRWHPAAPDLATDPAKLADQVMWLHGRRVEDPIDAYIDRTVADAHPDADQIREAERNADTAYHHAEQSRRELDETVYAELRPYGPAAHTADATGELATVADELAGVDRDLRTATARVDALESEPRIRTLPGGGLLGERERWAADRLAREEAASHDAIERWQRQEKSRRIEPPPSSRSTPAAGGASVAETA